MNWSKIPLALRIALILELVRTGASFALEHTHSFSHSIMKVALAQLGLGLAIDIFLVYGLFELSRLLVGSRATGARIAMFGAIALVAMFLVSIGYQFGEHESRTSGEWMQWAWAACRVAVGVGLTIAAMRNPIVAITSLVVWVVAVAGIPPLETKILALFGESANVMWSVITVAYIAITLVLAWVAVDDLPENFTMPNPQAAKLGLERISRAMTVRLIAFAALPLITMFLVVGGNPRDLEKTLAMTSLLANGVMLLSFVMLGCGALDVARSRHPEVQRWPFVVSAIAALWCGGVLLHQAPELYRALDHGHGLWGGASDSSFASMFTYTMPLVASAGVAVGSWAIGRFALRRDNLELAARGDRAALLVIVMQLLSIGTMVWMLPEVRSTGSFLLVMLMALTFGLIAIVVPGRLARDAALAIIEDAPPAIPAAHVL